MEANLSNLIEAGFPNIIFIDIENSLIPSVSITRGSAIEDYF
jgi:hypothetical protein